MPRVYRVLVTVVLFLVIFTSACAPKVAATEVPPEVTEPPTDVATVAPVVATTEAAAVATEQSVEPQFPDFIVSNFNNSTAINNQWLPMTPGTHWVYEGSAVSDEGKNVDRRIEFTVTDLTKEIQGVRTVVGWIEDFTDGQLTEKEISFYAQDNS